MPRHLEGRKIVSRQMVNRVYLLTTHDHPHILDKMEDEPENRRCSPSSLVRGESIQPFQRHLIVIPSRRLPYKFLWVALSQANR